ncbi:hypothetical protein ACSBR1_026210 [Camellia fascicularis]
MLWQNKGTEQSKEKEDSSRGECQWPSHAERHKTPVAIARPMIPLVANVIGHSFHVCGCNGHRKVEIEDVIFVATRYGIHEVVEEVVESFPQAIWYVDKDNYNIFGLAVIYRCENVFNLIYQMSGHKQAMMFMGDKNGNNMLHLAGRVAPFDKLNLVPGAALQMHPAALIATIAFAAVITVPGGTNGTNGVPVFSKANEFIVFIISDAISLFTSTVSLLMFLSILTSRYAEGDFLYVLPKRLIIGLVTLFMSITAMILAFSSALYLVFGNNKEWILIPVAALACLPITSFVSLQFPLLVDLISSTYGRGIFGKQSDRLFY